MKAALLALVIFAGTQAADISLWDATSSVGWHETNDPVMGGKSTGSFSISGGLLKFKGEVVDVPRLHAPGFIKIESGDGRSNAWKNWFSGAGGSTNTNFADISSCKALVIKAKANHAYDGYRFSFGTKRSLCSFFTSGFKTHFTVPADGQFHEVKLPFTSFSNCNSDSTGEPSKTCAAHAEVCPHASDLKDISPLGIWGEGKAGTVDLEVQSIVATGCSPSESVVVTGRNLRRRRAQSEQACSGGQKPYTRVEKGTCAQTCLGKRLGFCPIRLVTKYGKLNKGTCADVGYSKAVTGDQATMTQKAGPCGHITFKSYTQDVVVVKGRQ